MPTYDFACSACNHRFEASQDRDAATAPPCPSCGSTSRRLIGGGGGFVVRSATGPTTPAASGGCRREREGVGCCGRADFCAPGESRGSCGKDSDR